MNQSSTASSTGPGFREAFGDGNSGVERARDAAELRARLEERIRERPMLAITVGAIAGFLLGRLLRD